MIEWQPWLKELMILLSVKQGKAISQLWDPSLQKPKLCIVVWSNLVQAQNNNANGIIEKGLLIMKIAITHMKVKMKSIKLIGWFKATYDLKTWDGEDSKERLRGTKQGWRASDGLTTEKPSSGEEGFTCI